MSEETKVSESRVSEQTSSEIADQMHAGHRCRMNGEMVQNFGTGKVQFHEVLPDERFIAQQTEKQLERQEELSSMPESYVNYATQLLEQMRGVYSTSWDSCNNGGDWHGGHHHFYNPCSGADVLPPPNQNSPVYDCTNQCGCGATQPVMPYPTKPINGPCPGGTTTYYDDCAYQLQKLSDQVNHIYAMVNELYSTNQQLFSYLIEYYNTAIGKSK